MTIPVRLEYEACERVSDERRRLTHPKMRTKIVQNAVECILASEAEVRMRKKVVHNGIIAPLSPVRQVILLALRFGERLE